jgi:hypothetical protein
MFASTRPNPAAERRLQLIENYEQQGHNEFDSRQNVSLDLTSESASSRDSDEENDEFRIFSMD